MDVGNHYALSLGSPFRNHFQRKRSQLSSGSSAWVHHQAKAVHHRGVLHVSDSDCKGLDLKVSPQSCICVRCRRQSGFPRLGLSTLHLFLSRYFILAATLLSIQQHSYDIFPLSSSSHPPLFSFLSLLRCSSPETNLQIARNATCPSRNFNETSFPGPMALPPSAHSRMTFIIVILSCLLRDVGLVVGYDGIVECD